MGAATLRGDREGSAGTVLWIKDVYKLAFHAFWEIGA
jgi:hypothetical protein